MHELSIKYPAIEHSDDWLKSIARELSTSIHDNCLDLPKQFGKGEFRQYYPCEWLTVSYFRIFLKRSIEFHRIGKANRPYIPIVFYLIDTEQIVDDKHYHVGLHNPNGIFMPSPHIDSKWIVPANEWVTNLTLAFKKEWLLNQISNSDSYVYQLINQKDSFYIFESITPPLLKIIKAIEQEITSSHQLGNLKIFNHAFQLFTQFTEQLNSREKFETKINITSTDLKTLFKIRKILLDNVPTTPSIETLANEAAMSVSKLQKKFKQVFGKSISQFALREKMRLAKTLLATQNYSVSDVAYKLGYSNVSHFAKAFNNCYQINPSAYLASIGSIPG